MNGLMSNLNGRPKQYWVYLRLVILLLTRWPLRDLFSCMLLTAANPYAADS